MPIRDVNSKVIQQNSKIVERVLEPLQIPGCRLWIDGNFVYGKRVDNPSNGTVLGASGSTDVKDLSSSGLSLIQATSAYRPTFQSASKSILFDGVDDVLGIGTNTLGKNIAVLETLAYIKINTLTRFAGTNQRFLMQVTKPDGFARFNIQIPMGTGDYILGIRYSRLDSDSPQDISVPFNDINNYNFFHFKLNWTTGIGTIRINNEIKTFSLGLGTGLTSNTNSSINTGIGGSVLNPTLLPFSGNIKHLSYYERGTELPEKQIQDLRTGILTRNQ